MKKSIYKKNVRKKKIIDKRINKNQLKKNCSYNNKYVIKIIKFISLIIFIYFHDFCNNLIENQLNYYYTKRREYIKILRRHYDESNLITFEDKINWLAIHDVK